jgi:hypothetical protein
MARTDRNIVHRSVQNGAKDGPKGVRAKSAQKRQWTEGAAKMATFQAPPW